MTMILDGVDTATVGCVLSARQGWVDSLDHKQNLVEIPQATPWLDLGGDPQADVRRIVAGGDIIGADHAELLVNIEALNALVATGVLVEVAFTDEGADVIANGYARVSYLEERPIFAARSAKYRIEVVCPDPRIYQRAGGTLTPFSGQTSIPSAASSGSFLLQASGGLLLQTGDQLLTE